MELDRLFQHLIDQLYQSNSKNTLLILAQAGSRFHKTIHKSGWEAADKELINTYCSGSSKEQVLIFKELNPDFVLFTPMTFRLIHHLLIHNVDCSSKTTQPNHTGSNIEKSIDYTYDQFSLVGVCLIANQILEYVDHSEMQLPISAREIRNYYLRCLTDPTSAISRARMYDSPYFSNKLESIYEISAKDLIDAIFDFFVHISSKDPAIIDPDLSFNSFLEQEKTAIAQDVLHILSQKYLGIPIPLNKLIETLCDDLYLDRYCRGKPFIQVEDRHYCFRPDLIDNALADLPFHLIFTKLIAEKSDTNDLKDQRGLAYQNYLCSVTRSILGEESCKNINLKKSGEYGDLIIEISSEKVLMLEVKLADPQESLKKGDVEEMKKRFLIPQKRKRGGKEVPGPLQLMQRAMEYRTKFNYTGIIHTAVISYGWFPEIDIFDDLYIDLIKKNEICTRYDADKNNSPLILMNGFTWELILSSIKQKTDPAANKLNELDAILDTLKIQANSPSKTSSTVEMYIKSQGLRFSVYPLFEKTITDRADISRKSLKR
jgi:hypothetical protein